jgi:hypothetical protein
MWSSSGSTVRKTNAARRCSPGVGRRTSSVRRVEALRIASWRGARCGSAACRTQTSLTAGTIFAFTKLDLTVWFRAMFHMRKTKQGVSALELSRRLDVNYNTAWKMHHKLRQVMLERNQGKPLDGRIEMDDARRCRIAY